MLKKKSLALLLVLMLGIATVTGCNTTELNYFNLAQEVGSQKIYTDAGTIELNVAQLPPSFFAGNDIPGEEAIRKAFDQYSIEYTGKVDIYQDACQYDFCIINKTTSVKDKLFTIIYQKDVIYVKVDDFVKYMEQYCDAVQKQDLDKVFQDVEWLTITDQDIRNLEPGQTMSINNLLQKNSRQQAIIFRLYNGLINDAYASYSPNLVSQNGNQYILTLRGSQLIDVAQSASIYTLNNIEKIGDVLKAFVNSLSPTELADFGYNNESKVKAVESIDYMVSQVMFNRENYLQALQPMDASSQQEFLNMVNDSEIVSTLEKIDATTYNTSARIHFNMTGSNPTDKINFTITNKYTIKVEGAIQIALPTEKVITLTDLDQLMSTQ